MIKYERSQIKPYCTQPIVLQSIYSYRKSYLLNDHIIVLGCELQLH